MFKTVITVLFSLVLVVDFLAEVNKKNINVAELLVRAFMVVAFGYIMSNI